MSRWTQSCWINSGLLPTTCLWLEYTTNRLMTSLGKRLLLQRELQGTLLFCYFAFVKNCLFHGLRTNLGVISKLMRLLINSKRELVSLTTSFRKLMKILNISPIILSLLIRGQRCTNFAKICTQVKLLRIETLIFTRWLFSLLFLFQKIQQIKMRYKT